MKFSVKDFFSKCDQFPADLVTFTAEILNGKLHFLFSACEKIKTNNKIFSYFIYPEAATGGVL